LRESPAQQIVRERQNQSFSGIEDLLRRVPELQKSEIVHAQRNRGIEFPWQGIAPPVRALAGGTRSTAGRAASGRYSEQLDFSPLQKMTDEERLIADFHGSGMTTGPHPMAYCSANCPKQT